MTSQHMHIPPTSPPGQPVCQGQSTTGVLDQGQAQLGQALNRIAATAIERDVAHLIYRCNGLSAALRIVTRFREIPPGQLALWGRV